MQSFKMTCLVTVCLLVTQAGVSRAQSVFIDFETLPDGSPTTPGEFIGDAYAEWGIIFGAEGVDDMPDFWIGYNSEGVFAWSHHCTYPPGFNIIADFTVSTYTITTDVMSAVGYTVTMIAKDADGNTIGSIESDPIPPGFWGGPLSLTTDVPIASVEWWPSAQNASVGVDNLSYGEECPGDIDGDGDTDHSDLGELLSAWCTHEGDPDWNPNADLDGDGHVGHGDLGILLADWHCGV